MGHIGREVTNGVWLQDACRYVDDIRLTITTAPGIDPTEAQARVMAWLGQLLTGSCPGLEFSQRRRPTVRLEAGRWRLFGNPERWGALRPRFPAGSMAVVGRS